jgi:hypothetical protein
MHGAMIKIKKKISLKLHEEDACLGPNYGCIPEFESFCSNSKRQHTLQLQKEQEILLGHFGAKLTSFLFRLIKFPHAVN